MPSDVKVEVVAGEQDFYVVLTKGKAQIAAKWTTWQRLVTLAAYEYVTAFQRRGRCAHRPCRRTPTT